MLSYKKDTIAILLALFEKQEENIEYYYEEIAEEYAPRAE